MEEKDQVLVTDNEIIQDNEAGDIEMTAEMLNELSDNVGEEE